MVQCEQATVCDLGGLRFRESRESSKLDLRDEIKDTPEIITTCHSHTDFLESPGITPPVTPQVIIYLSIYSYSYLFC